MDDLSNEIQLETIVGEQELSQGKHSEDAAVAICSEIYAEVKIYVLKLPP